MTRGETIFWAVVGLAALAGIIYFLSLSPADLGIDLRQVH